MDVMRHRIGVTFEAEAENITSAQILTELMDHVEALILPQPWRRLNC